MAEQQNEPLIAAASEPTVVNVGVQRDDSSKKAFRVAGFTMLACLLIAGQALTAYFVLNQKSQITTLEQSTDSLKKELNRRPSGGPSASRTMHMPMYNLPMMMDESAEQPAPKGDPSTQTKCQLEAAGPGVDPSAFRPRCDGQGNYLPIQCWRKTGLCWCVNKDGVEIEDSATPGMPRCGSSSSMPAGARSMAAMPSLMKMSDDE